MEAIAKLQSDLEEKSQTALAQLQSKLGAEVREKLGELSEKEVEIQVIEKWLNNDRIYFISLYSCTDTVHKFICMFRYTY